MRGVNNYIFGISLISKTTFDLFSLVPCQSRLHGAAVKARLGHLMDCCPCTQAPRENRFIDGRKHLCPTPLQQMAICPVMLVATGPSSR